MVLPSSLIHCIATKYLHSPCERTLLLSHPYGGTAQSRHHMQGLTVHERSSLDGASCYSSLNSPLTFLCPDFWGKLAMGEGRTLLISPRPLPPCSRRQPQVFSCTCPSQCSGQCSSGGAFILSTGPATIHTNNNNVFNGLPGLKATWIPCRSVFNSLSQAEGLSLQRCLQWKHC